MSQWSSCTLTSTTLPTRHCVSSSRTDQSLDCLPILRACIPLIISVKTALTGNSPAPPTQCWLLTLLSPWPRYSWMYMGHYPPEVSMVTSIGSPSSMTTLVSLLYNLLRGSLMSLLCSSATRLGQRTLLEGGFVSFVMTRGVNTCPLISINIWQMLVSLMNIPSMTLHNSWV